MRVWVFFDLHLAIVQVALRLKNKFLDPAPVMGSHPPCPLFEAYRTMES